MELDGAKRCFKFLKDSGLQIPIFISDRHKGIANEGKRRKPNTSTTCGMFAKDFPNRS